MPLSDLLRLPYRSFVIVSPLPRELAVRGLRKAVAPVKWFRFRKPEQPFEGEVRADGFRLYRIIRYRNSFLPLIVGKFENAASGSRIAITMRPIIVVVVVWIIWMAMALTVAGLALFAPSRGGGASRAAGLLVVAGLVAFGYLLASISFGFEARKAQRLLIEILSGSQARGESAASR